jgi:hydrogenase/urease accessory protein HupE
VRARALAAVLVAAALPAAARAHQAGLSYGSWTLRGDRLEATLRLSSVELSSAWPELAARGGDDGARALARAILATVSAGQAGGACAPPRLVAVRRGGADGLELVADLRCPRPGEPVEVRLGFVGRLPPGHVHLARLETAGGPEERVADAATPAFTVRPERDLAATALRFVALGVEHIATGWDHLAFLLGLLLAAGSLRDVLASLTSFTAAHALTLALATLGVISPSPRLVEPLIAASVAWVGIENLRALRAGAAPRPRWPAAFAFGLVHGCGFAGALQGLRLSGPELAGALVSFNAGVELCQAGFAAAVFPLLAWARRSRAFSRAGLPAGSAAVGLAGLVWLVERVAG